MLKCEKSIGHVVSLRFGLASEQTKDCKLHLSDLAASLTENKINTFKLKVQSP